MTLADGKVAYDDKAAALSDSLTMSLIIGVDATSTLLQQLMEQLRDAVQQLPCLVPDTVYLPAPPVYCPQPAITAEVMFCIHTEKSIAK